MNTITVKKSVDWIKILLILALLFSSQFILIARADDEADALACKQNPSACSTTENSTSKKPDQDAPGGNESTPAAADPCAINDYAIPQGCPGSKELNEEFRNNAKTQIDKVIDSLRPANAPNLLPESFNNQVIADKNNAGIPVLMSYIAGLIASVAGLVAMVNILYNSYLYISSKGDAGKTGKAIKAITWSLIGLVGIIFSYNIVYSVIKLIYEQVGKGGL